jgi:hypothetical protein
MNLYRRLLVLLVIPFSLLNTTDIQSFPHLDRKAFFAAGCVTGLAIGAGVTYVLAKNYCDGKLLEADTLRQKQGNVAKDELEKTRKLYELADERLKAEQKKAERVSTELAFLKKGMLATDATLNNYVNLAKKGSILERLHLIICRTKQQKRQDQVHVSGLEVASELMTIAGESSSIDAHKEGILQGLPVDCAEKCVIGE